MDRTIPDTRAGYGVPDMLGPGFGIYTVTAFRGAGTGRLSGPPVPTPGGRT